MAKSSVFFTSLAAMTRPAQCLQVVKVIGSAILFGDDMVTVRPAAMVWVFIDAQGKALGILASIAVTPESRTATCLPSLAAVSALGCGRPVIWTSYCPPGQG